MGYDEILGTLKDAVTMQTLLSVHLHMYQLLIGILYV